MMKVIFLVTYEMSLRELPRKEHLDLINRATTQDFNRQFHFWMHIQLGVK